MKKVIFIALVVGYLIGKPNKEIKKESKNYITPKLISNYLEDLYSQYRHN